MLARLSLKNLATISDTTLELSPGLNVLTGETGAGKSILVDGLLLALGTRADTGLVRPGERLASVEAHFETSQGDLIVRREVYARGRSRMFCDDRLCTLEEARGTVGSLVDLLSQRSTPALLSRRTQQRWLVEMVGAFEQREDLFGSLRAQVKPDDFRKLYADPLEKELDAILASFGEVDYHEIGRAHV